MLMAISAIPGSFVIALYPTIYFNKIINFSRYAEIEWFVFGILIYSLFILYIFSFFQSQKINPQIYHIKYPIFMFFIMGFITILLLLRIQILLDINSTSLTYKFLLYRTKVNEFERGLIYFLRYLFIDCVGWIIALSIMQNERLHKSQKLYILMMSVYFIFSFTKSKIVFFALSLWIVRNRFNDFNLVTLLKTSLTMIGALLLIWYLLVDFDSLEYLYDPTKEGLIARIVISEISALYAHIAYFSDLESLGFSSISGSLSALFGLPNNPRSGEIIMQVLNPSWVERGLSGTFNTHFTGEAFANFSYAGLFLSPFVVGFSFIFYNKLIKILSSREHFPMMLFLTFNLNVMAGFNNFIYFPFFVLSLLVFLFIKLMRQSYALQR